MNDDLFKEYINQVILNNLCHNKKRYNKNLVMKNM